MKFNRSKRINQRIEHITTDHLVVGIDISKETHVAGAVNYRGIEVGKTISFANDQIGFEKLMRWVCQLQKSHELPQVIFGMESTGHYGMPLAQWLHDHYHDVVQVSPLTTQAKQGEPG